MSLLGVLSGVGTNDRPLSRRLLSAGEIFVLVRLTMLSICLCVRIAFFSIFLVAFFPMVFLLFLLRIPNTFLNLALFEVDLVGVDPPMCVRNTN